MANENHPRVLALQVKLKARFGKKEYEESNKAIQAEIERITATPVAEHGAE